MIGCVEIAMTLEFSTCPFGMPEGAVSRFRDTKTYVAFGMYKHGAARVLSEHLFRGVEWIDESSWAGLLRLRMFD
jgi:hypothetical protein